MSKPKSRKFWSFKALDDKTGELTLYGEISEYSWWGDEITPKQFKDDLDALGDIELLNVYVNSPGGDVFAGQAIHSILKRHKAKVNIHVDGLAASIASIVVMAGDTVTMPKNTLMMIHNPWTFGFGNAAEFRKLANDLDQIRESMIAAYLVKTREKLEREKLIELLDAETWLTAEECLEYGFCDGIEDAKQVAASLDKKFLSRYKSIPTQLVALGDLPAPESEPESEPEVDKTLKQKLLLELEL